MTKDRETPIKLDDDTSIPGRHPIVLIGPNGSGKTRFGVKLAKSNNAEFLPALRNIALRENIPMRPLSRAVSELKGHYQRHRDTYWAMADELNELFSKLLVQNADAAIRFRDSFIPGSATVPEDTTLMRLREMWHKLFPGRTLDFFSYNPRVTSSVGSAPVEYSATSMSDGERVALYLGARVLNAETDAIIVDEPEVHLHSRLAARFWNELEELRSDLRFVYITHDLHFALSRRGAQFVVLKPQQRPQVVPVKMQLPADTFETILGAASFSIHASRIIFCEGIEGHVKDYALYSAWFNGVDTAVIPVGSCHNVINCAQAFADADLVRGVRAIGLIDRDYWPERYLESVPANVHVLPVHEIENVYCVRAVFVAVANHLNVGTVDANAKYDTVLTAIRESFDAGLFAKQLSERFKRRMEGLLEEMVHGIKMPDVVSTLRDAHTQAMDFSNWHFDPEAIFDKEEMTLRQALVGDASKLHQFFPGKPMIGRVASSLGVSKERYRELVESALSLDDTNALGKKLCSALETVLPPRKDEDVQQANPGDSERRA